MIDLGKLGGEAKRWYENNATLDKWEILKSALLERFTTADSLTKTFEKLKERKQKSDESVTSCYDNVIKLRHDYDPTMSDKMIISWLENDVKDSLKISIRRKMKLLIEPARTSKAVLKIAKVEEQLQEEHVPVPDPTLSYVPYFTKTVLSTTSYQRTTVTATFVKPPDIQSPVLLANDITLPPYSETQIIIKIHANPNEATETLIEPTPTLYSRQIFLTYALITAKNNISALTIINATDRPRTLSKNTKYGKLFNLRQSSIIKAIIQHALETGHHPPVHTLPYRVSYKDEQSGYFQVGLASKDRPKTAFSTRDLHYQFTSNTGTYPVAIFSSLSRRCHHIEQGNIKPNADNIHALLKTLRPTTAKEAFRFVKAAEYYRKIIPKFSLITQPLYKYAPTTTEQRSRKSPAVSIQLSDEEVRAFDQLKQILTNDLILRIPNDTLPFEIQTDAFKIDTAFDDPDDYSPTQSRATQTENPTPASIIAPVVARSRAKQQLDKVANDNPINQSRDERAKRNNELTQNSSCKKTITEHQQVMETDNQIIPFTQERLKELQHQDDEIQQLMKNIDASDDYIMMDNMLIKNSIPPVPFVPNGRLRSDIIKIYHDTPANGAHFGRD
ncbi:unnamed protein product [Adineta ricciae]|uniref:Uncharacterized protein n=1 Tax=Adineta ricciae TaxID=249248 RepID=A0A815S8D8_ADIRI|nr:unnamed protein product [Adineta ricciae]